MTEYTEAPRKWGFLHRFPFERIHPAWVYEDENPRVRRAGICRQGRVPSMVG